MRFNGLDYLHFQSKRKIHPLWNRCIHAYENQRRLENSQHLLHKVCRWMWWTKKLRSIIYKAFWIAFKNEKDIIIDVHWFTFLQLYE